MTAPFDQQLEAKAGLAALRRQLETRVDRLPGQVRTVVIQRGDEEQSQGETALAKPLSSA